MPEKSTLLPVRASHLPQGGVEKEFREAALEAVNAASHVRLEGPYDLYNVYLSRGLALEGFTPNLPDYRESVRRRRLIFTRSPRVYWGITFSRGQKWAVAHHRSGFIARLQKG